MVSVFERVGAFFKADKPKQSLFTESATDQILNSLITMGDPDEVLRKAGISRTKLRALMGDDEIMAAMETRREALLAVPWHLEGKGKDFLFAWAEWENFHETAIRGMHGAVSYGYAVQEIVYAKRPDGKIGFSEITAKPFEWFVPNLDGSVLYKSLRNPKGEPTDPRKFFLTVRNQEYNNRYGEALFSRLYWPWFFRQQGWRFWVKWLERFGTPMLVGKTSGDATEMAKALAKAVQNSVAAVGNGDDIQVVAGGGTAGHFEGFNTAISKRINKVILGQTLTSDTHGVGSQALGNIHNEVRLDRRNSDIRLVSKTAQRMVSALWALNGFSGEAPVFRMEDGAGLEKERADRDATLVNANVLQLTDQYLYRVYDYEEGDFIAGYPSVSAEAGRSILPKVENDTGRSIFAAGGKVRFTKNQQVVEDEIDSMLANVASPISDADIKAAIRAATSPGDLNDRLAVLLSGVPPKDFEQVASKAFFAADLLGYAHASDK
jgi:phage gp29-like protein